MLSPRVLMIKSAQDSALALSRSTLVHSALVRAPFQPKTTQLMQEGLLREAIRHQQQAAAVDDAQEQVEVKSMTLTELGQKKRKAHQEAFGQQAAQKEKMVLVKEQGRYVKKPFSEVHGMKQVRPKRGDIGQDVKLPAWGAAIIEKLRSTCFFKACIAREKETPLTPLHLMQPVAGLLFLCGIASLALAVLRVVGIVRQEARTIERQLSAIMHIVGTSLASSALLYVGLKARDCPSQEKLHVELADQITDLGVSADHTESFADDAEGLAAISLNWIEQRKQQKDETQNLLNEVKRMSEQRWEFELKQHLCKYLMKGELELTKRRAARLEQQLLNEEIPVAQYREQKKSCYVDGNISARELERVVTQIHVTESSRTLYGILGKVLKELCDAPANAEAGVAPEERSWSYRDIFLHVQQCARDERYSDEFDEVLKIDAGKGGGQRGKADGKGGSAGSLPAELSEGMTELSEQGGGMARRPTTDGSGGAAAGVERFGSFRVAQPRERVHEGDQATEWRRLAATSAADNQIQEATVPVGGAASPAWASRGGSSSSSVQSPAPTPLARSRGVSSPASAASATAFDAAIASAGSSRRFTLFGGRPKVADTSAPAGGSIN